MGNINQGDIIIFEARDNWVDKCIAKLTGSDAVYAAMAYTDNKMAGMGKEGIQLKGCYELPGDDASKGSKAYLMRLTPGQNPGSLIDTAKKYMARDIKCNYADLIFLAGILIYRSVSPAQHWKKIVDSILLAACSALDKLLEKILHKRNKVSFMTCTQFIYQCYYDCGEKYKIILNDKLLQSIGITSKDNNENVNTGNVSCSNTDSTVRLSELLGSAPEDTTQIVTSMPEDFDLESKARELCHSIDKGSETDGRTTSADIKINLQSTINYAKKFLDLLESILEKSDINIPVPTLFITPGDLLEHAVNLEKQGTVIISHEKP